MNFQLCCSSTAIDAEENWMSLLKSCAIELTSRSNGSEAIDSRLHAAVRRKEGCEVEREKKGDNFILKVVIG